MKRIVTSLLLLICATAMQAQHISHTFKGQSLAAVLKILDREQTVYRINFIFDELEDFTVTTSFKNKDLHQALREVVGFYPVSITTDEENKNIFLECIKKEKTKLVGRLLDQRSQPVVYANIALLNPADSSLITGGVSNENGDFVIPCSSPGVLMRVSCVGYKTLYRQTPIADIGTVRMQAETIQVKNVVVKGQRPAFQMGREGLVANILGTDLSKAGTAGDVLGMLPNLTVDNGKVSVFGRTGEPLIYINGKKMQDKTELTLLKSADMNQVEVITNPGAQYDATVTAVIKIKTNKKAGDGWSGLFETFGKQSHRSSGSQNVNLNYRTGGWDISGSLYGGYWTLKQTQTMIGNIPGIVVQDTRFGSTGYDKGMNGRWSVNYTWNERHAMGVSYNVSGGKSHALGTLEMDDTHPDNSRESYVNHMTFNTLTSPIHNINAYYNGTVGKLSIDFNADYSFKKGRIENGSHIVKTADMYDVTSFNTNRSRLFATKLVLSYPLWKGNLTGGYEHTHTRRNSIFDNMGGIETHTNDEVTEQTFAGFAEYNAEMGAFNLSAGIRYEHNDVSYRQQGVLKEEQSPTRNDWFPSVGIGYGKGKLNVRLGYLAKTSRPHYDQLAGNRQYDNDYVYEGGNPLLKPARIHTLSLDVQYHWLTFSSSFQQTHDAITSYTEKFGTKSILMIPVNADKLRNIHTMVAFSHRFGFWQPRYSIGFNKQFFDMKEYGMEGNFNKPYWTFKLNNSFYLPLDILLTMRYIHFTSGNTSTAYQYARNAFFLSVQKSFFKGSLDVKLDANDIFKGYWDESTFRTSLIDSYRKNYSDNRNVNLTLTYRFNTTKNKYKGTGAGDSEKQRL